MKKNLMLMLLLLLTCKAIAQTTGSIVVGGDPDKFYPTVWADGGWNNNTASKLTLGRSSVHQDIDWKGSLVAEFRFHTSLWGNGANFIDADIVQHHNILNGLQKDFIAGWKDVSVNSSNASIVIWLRGGSTTYFYNSLFPISPVVYDGVANPLPYQEVNEPAMSFKTSADAYVNSNGISKAGTAFFNGSTNNFFAGNVGIGTYDPKGYKLAVAGNMIAESVKVQLQGSWADYVFDEGYKLPKLNDIESFVKEHKHLPEIPSAAQVKSEGIDLGQMNEKLLKKIEELTLHLIEKDKEIKNLQKLNLKVKDLELKMKAILNKK
jgi:hypothetical protein